MRVLVTGGCGFVGRHFSKRLSDEGHEVTIVDDMSAGQFIKDWMFPPQKSIQFFRQDIRTFIHQRKADEFDLLIHCAAVVGGRLKIENAPLDVAADVAIDADFFKWAVNARPPKPLPLTIYFSSSAVYPLDLQSRTNHVALGEHFVVPQHQLRLGMPDQTYGWSKLCGEVLAQHAVKTYGLPVKIYRPFGGYGEDQSFDYPFPSIVRRIVTGENPVTVWGSGDQQRDFIHIDLIVDIVLDTMHRMQPGETLNLGAGYGLSFRELARIASDVLKIPIDIVNDASKPEGVFARVADPYKLNEFYPMSNARSELEEGIKKVAKALLDGTKSP